jgi:hypothetical protein
MKSKLQVTEFIMVVLYFSIALLALELKARDYIFSLLGVLMILVVVSINKLYKSYNSKNLHPATLHGAALIGALYLLLSPVSTNSNVFSILMQVRGYLVRPLFATKCAASAFTLPDGSKIGICEFSRAETHAYIFDDHKQLFIEKNLRSTHWKSATEHPGPLHIFNFCDIRPRRIGGNFLYIDINCYNN